MRLVFLGTGPADAIPRAGHRDALCVDARRGGKSRRSRSAALVEHEGARVLVDAGPDVADQLARERFPRLDAVVLTHGHRDAAGGIGELDRILAERAPSEVVSLWTDKVTRARIERKFPARSALRLETLRPGEPFAIGRLRSLPFEVSHSVQPGFPTVGYLFGTSLAYASDAAEIPARSRAFIAGVDTLVLDAAAWFGRFMAAHLTPDRAIRVATDVGARRLVLTQTGHTYPPHEGAEREVRAFWRSLGVDRPKTVCIAFDGLRLEV